MYETPSPGKTITLLLMVVAGVLISADARACACCARSDVWVRDIRGPSDYEYAEVSRLSGLNGLLVEGVGERDYVFLKTARPVEISGSPNDQGGWTFVFRDEEVSGDNVTRLLFSPGRTWEFFMTYTGDWAGRIEPDVDLYKEVLIPGKILVEGRLAALATTNEHPARLIIKGQGNRCFGHEDFDRWILEFTVKEQGGRVTFVGSGTARNITEGGR